MRWKVQTEEPVVTMTTALRESRNQMSALQRSPHKKRQMMLAGGFGLGAALLLLFTPELGIIGAIGTLGMGAASAITTLMAKH